MFFGRRFDARTPREAWIQADDVEDQQDNSNNWVQPSHLVHSSVQQLIQKRRQGLTGQWHIAISQKLIPSSVSPSQHAHISAEIDSRGYNGQYSPDGQVFYCSTQDDIVVFDTSDPFDWSVLKRYEGLNIQWTISDIDISPSRKYLLYSTMSSYVTLLALEPDEENRYNLTNVQQMFSLSSNSLDFAVYSVKFSGAGNEILAGTSMQSLEIYDLEYRTSVYHVDNAHRDDIGTVCWANRDESQVFFTGSDDSTIRVWDRRSIRSNRDCVGVLAGHREGVSHIASRGDGIHVISNGKDQCCKLWDIRKVCSQSEYATYSSSHHYQTGFDYRWEHYPLEGYTKRLAIDCSVKTFRGHTVLGTLIRCHFSPLFSTGQRFVYSGSARGGVHIYDTVTGASVRKLCPEGWDRRLAGATTRDVSWHPYLPLISSTSFAGGIISYSSSNYEEELQERL